MPLHTHIKAIGLPLNRKQICFSDAIWAHEAVGNLAARSPVYMCTLTLYIRRVVLREI